MAKRQVYTGMYTRLRPRSGPAQNNRTCASRNLRNFRDYRALASHVSRYIWTAYNMMYGNYLALATVFAVVILSFLIPDISQKIHKTSELKSMKKVLNVMTKEVGRAEVACLTAADEICCLHCSMEDDATETQQPRNFQNMSVCSCHYIRPTMSEPMQIEKKIGFFNRIFLPHRNTSHKEIAIMSYVYTDSFNAEKKIELTDLYDEILPTRSTATFTSDSS